MSATTPGATDASSSAAVKCEGVTCRFTSKRSSVLALDDVSMEVAAGDFVSVVGPSGCGKSTLLKIIAGLVRPTEGTVRLLGKEVTEPQRNVGFVFQRPALLDWRGVRKNILIQAEMRGLPKKEAAERADRLIEMTGLSGFEDALPHELSGGMQQRVALCRALLHEPPVLLMDEPFGALDALTRETMNIELRRIWRETRCTIVLVTHSVAESVYLANRVEVMSTKPGRILETLPVDLPQDRDLSDTMGNPTFGRLTHHIRGLLGASSAHD